MALAVPPAVALTTASQTLHICRDGFRQMVEVIVANVNAANPATLTLGWTDASAANAASVFAFTDVAAKDGLMSPRKVVEPGDKITGLASANGYLTASAQVVYEEPVT